MPPKPQKKPRRVRRFSIWGFYKGNGVVMADFKWSKEEAESLAASVNGRVTKISVSIVVPVELVEVRK